MIEPGTTVGTWLQDIIGTQVRRGEEFFARRRYLEVIGAVIEDDPIRNTTRLTITGGGGGVGADRVINGTSPIRINGGNFANLGADLTISVLDATSLQKGVLRLTNDLAGTADAPITARLNGATVPAAGSLTIGQLLQVSGSAALIYAALNLANPASVVNRLSITNIGFDNPDTVLTTNHAGNATQYRLLVDDNIDPNAAIAVSKLHSGPTNGFVLTRVGGVATWAAPSGGGPGTVAPGLARQMFITTNAVASDWVTITGDATTPINPGAFVVSALRGAAIGTAAPSLTPGTVLRAVTNSTIDYGAVALNNEAAVSGALAINHIAPHSAIALLTTNGSLAVEWATTIPGGLLPALNGDVTGAPATNTVMRLRGAAIGTAAGTLTPGHSMRVTAGATCDWGSLDLSNENAIANRMLLTHLSVAGATLNDVLAFNGTNYAPTPLSSIVTPSTVQIVANMTALEALPVTPLADRCMCIVQTPPRRYWLNKTGTPGLSGGDDNVPANGGGRWEFTEAA